LSSSGRPASAVLGREPWTTRQLWIVIDPAGPVSSAAVSVGTALTSASDRQPTHVPESSYWENSSASWLPGTTISGPCSGPQSYRYSPAVSGE
jgi:hypothetical protein